MTSHTKSGNETTTPQSAKDKVDAHILTGIKLYSVLSGVMIATLLISLDVSIIATAIPAITSQFNAAADIGWYGAAYPLSMCALQPLGGKIATIFSLRWSYLIFFGIFLIGSLLCGVAINSNMFIIGRAVAGTGGSGVVSGGLSVIAMSTPSSQRPLFTGLITSLYVIGMVLAPIIGGALTEKVTWRWCFLINLPTGAVTIGTLMLFFHPPQKTTADAQGTALNKMNQLDLIGCGVFVPSIVMAFLALQWGGDQHPWRSATIIGLFVGFTASMVIFVLWELRKGEQAMIPFPLLRGRSNILSFIFAFLFVGSFIAPTYYLPEWFQIVKNASPMRSGVMLLPSVLALVAGSMISGVLAKHVRYYNPWFFVGSAMLCISCGLYTTFAAFTTSSGKWIGFQIIQGLGSGFAAQMPLLTVQNALKARPDIIPVGISTVLFTQYFGSAVMQTVASTVFQNGLVNELQSQAGLNATDVGILLDAGNLRVKETAVRNFPDRWEEVIIAYNDAITTVFYLAVAASALAFVLSTGIKWTNIAERAPDIEDDPKSGP